MMFFLNNNYTDRSIYNAFLGRDRFARQCKKSPNHVRALNRRIYRDVQ